MTRARQPKPTAPPLTVTLRAALASDWRTLAALDTLAGASGSYARRLVHEALREIKAGGTVLEERVGKGGVEVRLLTLPAPVPDDGQPGDLSPEDIEAIRASLIEEEDDASDGAAYCDEIAPLSPAAHARFVDLIEHPPAPTEALRALLAPTALAAPAPPVGQAAPVNALSAHLAAMGHVEEAREVAGLPAAPKGPGPASRCARPGCNLRHDQHDVPGRRGGGGCEAFQPKPRGRPRAPALPPVAPIPGAATAILPRRKASKTRGPVVDVDGGRVERTPFPPCIDCGEPDSGSCPEGRCRDCDIEHGMSAGACRECHVWIIREDVGGPFAKQHGAGCSLAEADDWRPRDAAEYAAVRTARYGWAPGAAAEPETSRGGSEGLDANTLDAIREVIDTAPPSVRERVRARRAQASSATAKPAPCRPPLCHADDIHEPSRLRAFARPLCEAHRRWVEGAGGTVASAADAAALHAEETV